ncbi:hypothetical protein PG985_001627 [Apiospora marii]|uniref:uncharacterized protein n=1 Tax=Apiospora marii TaxID=335849 RepID=UPI0031321928
MAAISDAQVDAILAAVATPADLPQRLSNPQASPQIKRERVADAGGSLGSNTTTLPPPPPPPMSPMPRRSCSQRALFNGPSPEKGSGQERFRQMMSGQAIAKTFTTPPATYPQLPGLKPQGTQLPTAADYYPTPMNGTDGRAVSVNPSSQLFTAATGYGKDSGTSRSESMPAPQRDTSTNNGTSSSNSSTNKGVFRTTYSSLLSSECQSRRFNPAFTEWEGSPGKFYAKVRIQDHTITDARAYRNAMEAKQALAKQAVQWIRDNLPKDEIPTRAAQEANLKQAQINRARADRVRSNESYYDTGARSVHGNGNGLANGLANGYGSGGGNGYSHYSPSKDRPSRPQGGAVADYKKSDRQNLLEQIRSLYGNGRGPSDAVLADPAAARAFLEGFALGDRLRESAARAERRRSRSPKAGGDRRPGRDYRERSAAARPDY